MSRHLKRERERFRYLTAGTALANLPESVLSVDNFRKVDAVSTLFRESGPWRAVFVRFKRKIFGLITVSYYWDVTCVDPDEGDVHEDFRWITMRDEDTNERETIALSSKTVRPLVETGFWGNLREAAAAAAVGGAPNPSNPLGGAGAGNPSGGEPASAAAPSSAPTVTPSEARKAFLRRE